MVAGWVEQLSETQKVYDQTKYTTASKDREGYHNGEARELLPNQMWPFP